MSHIGIVTKEQLIIPKTVTKPQHASYAIRHSLDLDMILRFITRFITRFIFLFFF